MHPASVPSCRRQAFPRRESRQVRGRPTGACTSLDNYDDRLLHRSGIGIRGSSLRRRRSSSSATGEGRMTKILHRDPDRRCKGLEEWPEPDRLLWQAALVPGDLLEDGGSRARHGEYANRNAVDSYGRWLAWLDRQGLLEATSSPADRITPARVSAYVADLEKHNSTSTLLHRVRELREVALVMDPDSRLAVAQPDPLADPGPAPAGAAQASAAGFLAGFVRAWHRPDGEGRARAYQVWPPPSPIAMA